MRSELRRGGDFLLGVAAGAALMFILDPARGRRRRGLVRDQVVHAGRELGRMRLSAEARARDLRNRARGAVAEARGRQKEEAVDDAVLEARVRSRLGHHHLPPPAAIEVRAHAGCVTLVGDLPAEQSEALVAAVGRVPGVRDVVARLKSHEPAGVLADRPRT